MTLLLFFISVNIKQCMQQSAYKYFRTLELKLFSQLFILLLLYLATKFIPEKKLNGHKSIPNNISHAMLSLLYIYCLRKICCIIFIKNDLTVHDRLDKARKNDAHNKSA